MSDADKPIGRRAFIVLMLAGVAALFVGKDLFGWSRGGGKPAVGTEGFRINSIKEGPRFDERTWRLKVEGLVKSPLDLTWAEFLALQQTEVVRDFHCVEGWGVEQVTWTGVRLSDLMKVAGADSKATHLVFHSGDEIYTDSLTIDEAMRSDSLLAHKLGGEPLTQAMGSPLRLILPGSFGYKYVKWVVRIEAVTLGPEGYQGYWEQRGYPADATI
jgi:sulfoxide reductase catalytic subunit YedY